MINDLGLEVVEQQTNHYGRGLDATVQTDLFVRDTTMNVKLQKIAAQHKIKQVLDKAVKDMGVTSLTTGTMGLARRGSMRLSSNNLSALSLVGLEKEVQGALQEAAKITDAIIKQGELIEAKIAEGLGEEVEVTGDV
jgi:hypothetical protein